mmetsp:Transcript_69141/g.84773  ORF Transcript_69141/g.84773 Transcript_69141/m.84773 type:complete len:422 (+) Transcript_69141:21-1286(+)
MEVVPVTDDDEEITLQVNIKPQGIVITKYDTFGFLVLLFSVFFFIFLPIYIIVLVIQHGIWYVILDEDTLWPFVFQLTLIPINGYFIFGSLRALWKKGFVVFEPDPKETTCLCLFDFIKLKEKIQETCDCRDRIYHKIPDMDPIEQTIELIYRSISLIAFLNLITTIPTIVVNFFADDDNLRLMARRMLFFGVFNQLMILYGIYSPCCNPFRGFCCYCKNGCCGINCGCNNCECPCRRCEKCCCYYVSCRCCLTHFPKHHRRIVEALAFLVIMIVLVSFGTNMVRLTKFRIYTFDDNAKTTQTQWTFFLLSFNYVFGYIGAITILKRVWDFFYILGSYWVRNDINEIENQKIHKIVSNWFRGGYIFYISLKKSDEFAKINNDTPIAKRINHPCTCYSCWNVYWLIIFYAMQFIWFVLFGIY